MTSRRSHGSGSLHVQRNRQPTAFPPYEPPTCPLNEGAKRSLANLTMDLDIRKYEKHLKAAVKNLTEFAGESNDHLYASQERVRRMAQKREAAQDDSEKTEAEEEAERRAREMEKIVNKLTTQSEKALRDLIDYKQELAHQGDLLQSVSDEVAAASTAAAAHESQSAILSPTELLKQTRGKYQAEYKSRTLQARYAKDNDYIGFKRTIHDAQNPGDNAPPVPPASSWFPDESVASTNPSAAYQRRIATQTNNTSNDDDDDDDDIQMTAVVSSLKCPLTLQTFREPYSNQVCKHTFEKSAILEFHRANAVAFVDPSQGGRKARGVPAGPKQLKCPERGCDAMLELKDFYLDNLILRQVKRQEAQAAAEMEEDLGEGDDVIVPSTPMERPQDDGDGAENPTGERRRHRVKKERMSKGSSRAHALEATPSDDGGPELIDMDE